MDDINVDLFCLNVNGMGDKTKRVAVLTKLRKMGKGIFLLQETHSTKSEELKWKDEWGCKNIIFSHGTSNSKGVAILFSNDLEYKLLKMETDNEGRYIIVDILYNDRILTIANLYAPTRQYEKEQIEVFTSFKRKVALFTVENLILGGDWNLYLDPKMDKLDSMTDSNDNDNYRREILHGY